MKRSISILLSLLMGVSLSLIACDSNEETKKNDLSETDSSVAEESGEQEMQTEKLPDIPEDVTFAGKTVQILSGMYVDYCYLFREESNGEALNDAIRKMQQNTEERLDISLQESQEVYVNNASSQVQQLCKSGDTTYAALNQLDRFTIELMMGGYLSSMQNVEYIDLENPWWHPNVNRKIRIGDDVYYAASSANLLMYANTSGMFLNTNLAVDCGVEPESLYEAVRQGSWDMDMLYSAIEKGNNDLNGNGKMENADQWGMCCFDQNILGNSYIMACGQDALVKDDDNFLKIFWNTETYLNAVEKAHAFYHNENVNTKATRHTADIFTEGRAIFMNCLFRAIDNLSEMKDDYAVLPFPKADATQPNYICVNYDLMLFSMPKFVQDTKLFGAVTDWLSYEGLHTVKEAYIENTLKYRKARDRVTAEMVQICLDSSLPELGSMYAFDQCGYDVMYSRVMDPKEFKFASYAKSQEKPLGKQLDKLYAAVFSEEEA